MPIAYMLVSLSSNLAHATVFSDTMNILVFYLSHIFNTTILVLCRRNYNSTSDIISNIR